MQHPKGIIPVNVAMTLLAVAIIATGVIYFITRPDNTVQETANTNVTLNTNTVVMNTNITAQQNTNSVLNTNTDSVSTQNTNTSTASTLTYTGSIEGMSFSFMYPNSYGVTYDATADSTYIFKDRNKMDLTKDVPLFSLWTIAEQDVVNFQGSVANTIANVACSADGPRGSRECLPLADTQVSNLQTDFGGVYSLFTPTLKITTITFDANDQATGSTTSNRTHGPFAFYHNISSKKYIYFSPDADHTFSAQDITDAKKMFASFRLLN